MSDRKLWSPSTTRNNINKFTSYINKEVNINTYEDLHRWSIEKKEVFWDKIWQFTNIIGEKKNIIFRDSANFIETKFFDTSFLNYAENCLQKNTNDEAIIFYNEQRNTKRISWKQLRSNVFKISYSEPSVSIEI